ncbi:hypothetical protein [Polyangium mundeleinium]|uniref:Uncharacterized protein n=1 Tax=Polyangium mundeleinium TaxID=2995306 RepID=A0ABT5F1J7_9BACT|nr:hypothetical protein [Polyangium mundeleinium]MDC0747504.1 hypothetical protein [Polyangium mundeleinium]
MQTPDVNASSEVYEKHTDHFRGAVEGWADAETLTAAQRAAIVEADAIVTAAADGLGGRCRDGASRAQGRDEAPRAVRHSGRHSRPAHHGRE